MRRRMTALTVSMVAIVLLATAAAYAGQVLTLTPSKTPITYGSPLKMTVVSSEPTLAPIVIEYRYPPASVWTTAASIPASRAVEPTVTVPVRKISGLAEFRARQGAVVSAVTTVSVMAKMKRPSVPASVRAGRTVTIEGQIRPRHAVGTVIVIRAVHQSGLIKTFEARVVGDDDEGSKYSYRWETTASDKGSWLITATHQDAQHAPAVSSAAKVKVR